MFFPSVVGSGLTQSHTPDHWKALGVASRQQNDFSRAAEYFNRASTGFLQNAAYDEYFDSKFHLLDCLLQNADLIEYREKFERTKESLIGHRDLLRPGFLDTAETTIWMFEIIAASSKGDVVRSIELLETTYEALKNRAGVSDAYTDQRRIQVAIMLAEAYARKGNCERTQTFSYISLQDIHQYYTSYLDDGMIILPYAAMAQCYLRAGDVLNANIMYQTIMDLLPNVGSRIGQRSFRAYKDLFLANLQAGNTEGALRYLEFLSNVEPVVSNQHELLLLKGRYLMATGDVLAARKSYLDAQRIILLRLGEKTENMAMACMYLGELYLQEGLFVKAAETFHYGLYCMSDEQHTADLLTNPGATALFRQARVLEMIKGKASALLKYFDERKDPRHIDAAWHTLSLGIQMMRELRTGYSGEADKSILVESTYPIFELALTVAAHHVHVHGNSTWRDTAFALIEESKALNLLDAVLHGHARKYAGIPDSLLVLEQALRTEIAGKQALIHNYRNDPHYQEAVEVRLHNALAQARSSYNQLIRRFERDHPRYYALSHAVQKPSISGTRALLAPDQMMLNYFVGDSSIFLIVISGDEQQLLRIARDFPLEDWVIEYRLSMDMFALRKDHESLTRYVESAHLLHQKLIPVELSPGTPLLVVPDGVLGYLSFASLLRSKPSSLSDIVSFDYMLWEHDIAYAYSAGLFREMAQRTAASRGTALICAPDFTLMEGVTPLQYNREEARNIRKQIGGIILSGNDCTLGALQDMLGRRPFRILHLATHGVANDALGDASYLKFSNPDGAHPVLLYGRDLYNMDIPIEIVYLSACETGTGELRRGEGIISLARSFFYAGARSLVTTLWSVEDEKSARIAELFYSNLKKRQPKDQALAGAQRAYLRTLTPDEKPYAHPVFWSALIPVGNMAPLSTSGRVYILQNINLWLLLAGLALVSSIVWWGIRKSMSRRSA